jgi:glycosyltransferase involved in cell wall biosynthesis
VRIALDATYSVGDELSGVGVYSREILEGLAAAHPESRFRWCFRPHRWIRSFQYPAPRNSARGMFGETWMLPPKPDLFHGLNQRMPSLRFRRSVCTFHDLFVMTGDYSSPEFRERFTRQAREAAARADLIITVSAFTASQVEFLLKVENTRLRVIHHGVRVLPQTTVQREPIVLHVGAVQHRKNIVRLVRAFERIETPWRLVLAGSAGGYGAAEAVDAIASSSARDRIEVTGYVSAAHLASLYARASVFAFPSLDEGFGMPVLEAMSRGIPVLASTRSALPEVCGDAALLVDALSTDEIAEGLKRLTEDEDETGRLREEGLRRASQFTWTEAVGKTWNVYRETAGQ